MVWTEKLFSSLTETEPYCELINLTHWHVQKNVLNSKFLLKPSALIPTAATLLRAPPSPGLCSELPGTPTQSPLSRDPGEFPLYPARRVPTTSYFLNLSVPRSLISSLPILGFWSVLSIIPFHLLFCSPSPPPGWSCRVSSPCWWPFWHHKRPSLSVFLAQCMHESGGSWVRPDARRRSRGGKAHLPAG